LSSRGHLKQCLSLFHHLFLVSFLMCLEMILKKVYLARHLRANLMPVFAWNGRSTHSSQPFHHLLKCFQSKLLLFNQKTFSVSIFILQMWARNQKLQTFASKLTMEDICL
jgi:hypothetical protein